MNNYFDICMDKQALQTVSELALAHVGDSVFELLVRSWLVRSGSATNSKNLHKLTVSHVSAPAQAAFVERLLPLLTEEESAVYRRGRNAHSHAAPKNATPGQYARSTGLETLFGWLYLTGHTQRISQLFSTAMEAGHAL